MIIRLLLPALFLFSIVTPILSQQKTDKGQIIEYKNEFWDKIEASANEYNEEDSIEFKFKMDYTGYELPTSVNQFTAFWHNDPISQGWSGMCWCFSTTSYFESEVYRVTGQKIKLSELHTVYWEYVEKARRFINERGNSEFGEGSEANAVVRMWKKYGAIPLEDYTGKPEDQEFHDHHLMFDEMTNYLNSVKEMNAWNEKDVLATIKTILDHYIGTPPEYVMVEGNKLTPKEYLKDVVQLDMDNYIDFMSLMEKPYYSYAEYKVPDNWWLSEEYYNIPLDDFMKLLNEAIQNGYTIDIGGDVSEAGYNAHKEVAMIPTFDIPSEFIDENARQFRFSNESTTDDHGIHIVGYMENDSGNWYLIKDSGSGSRNGNNKGYYFYHEDYIKLKMMNIMAPKDFAEEVLGKKLD